jgi:dUTPase
MASPKKKAAKKHSLIKYADDQLKPKSSAKIHPVYSNNPDRVQIIPGSSAVIQSGLEMVIPADQFVLISAGIEGLAIAETVKHGYQRDMSLTVTNTTGMVITIEPFERVADMFMCGMLAWS